VIIAVKSIPCIGSMNDWRRAGTFARMIGGAGPTAAQADVVAVVMVLACVGPL
jgi:hypothetical protein